MRVLLTGASGFVGTRLARTLVEAGAYVVNVGRRPCAVDGVENVLVPALTAECLRVGLSDVHGIDGVVHLAAAGVNPGDRDREGIFRLNATLAPQIVAVGASLGAKAVVMVGSSAEYRGPREASPMTEDAPLETQKVYGASKAAGGILALAEGAAQPIPMGILRLFNVFGPGEAPHRLLPSLAHSLSAGEVVKLSPGTQVRDFIYVDDACAGLIAALYALQDGSMASGAYNLSTGNGATVRDFAFAVASTMHADPAMLRFGALPFRPDDLPYVVGNSTKLTEACGWMSRISLTDGVAKTLAELRLNL